ncbi:unnamed protein product [Moneuplotes crassus]|uniref:EGF-like domain-containing protein n=1 Tax=Euplotes crassus TaxID=5936 RepID=A0AAD1XRK3_EUPCR|nr:unnamed protein product [Moneuplotes crassus]
MGRFTRPMVSLLFLALFIALGWTQDWEEMYSDPEIRLIEPAPREGSKGNLIGTQICGGTRRIGKSGFVAAPNTHVFAKWKTVHSDVGGMCKITIKKNSSEDFQPVEVLGYTEDGWFECGRKAGLDETKQFKTPNYTCEMCTLQFQFGTTRGDISVCSEISLKEGENISCEGKCVNGGTCFNGVCLCASGYQGKYCDGKGYLEDNTPSMWVILLAIVAIIVFFIIFGTWLVRFISNAKEKFNDRMTPGYSFNNEVADQSTEENNEDDRFDSFRQKRRGFKHHRVEEQDSF